MKSLKKPVKGKNSIKKDRLNLVLEVRTNGKSNPLAVHSLKLINTIESVEKYEHKEACFNMVDNSFRILKNLGYTFEHLSAWRKNLYDLIKNQSLKPAF